MKINVCRVKGFDVEMTFGQKITLSLKRLL
jgi:hypothetical protein